MRGWLLFSLLAAPAGAAGVAQVFAKSGDAAFAAGRWGEAMAAYDAAHNEAPGDAVISAHRRDAAARWVEGMAPQLATATPPEKALALLNALAEEGNKRGADAAVKQHVAKALDSAVLKVWSGEDSDDPKRLWQAISRGELLMQALPEGTVARGKLVALEQRASALYRKLAEGASQPGSAYLYAAMAARVSGGKADAGRLAAWARATDFDFKLTVSRPAHCPEIEIAFRAELKFMNNYFSSSGVGLPAQVDLSFDCFPLAAPRQRQEKRTWVESHLEFNSAKSCSDHTVLVEAGSHTETTVAHGKYADTVRVVDVPSTYKTVQDCSTTYSSREVNETKSDLLTITTEEQGYRARGVGAILVAERAYVMPINVKLVTEKVTTQGRIFGEKEGFSWFDPKMFATLTAHSIWLETVYLNEQAHEGRAGELVKLAGGSDADSSLGSMMSAVRVHGRVTKDYARWFADRVGLDEQELNELVLDAPRVKPSLRLGGYKLDVPKVDPNLARTVEQKKKSSGTDDFR